MQQTMRFWIQSLVNVYLITVRQETLNSHVSLMTLVTALLQPIGRRALLLNGRQINQEDAKDPRYFVGYRSHNRAKKSNKATTSRLVN